MGQMAKMFVEPMHAACGSHTLHWGANDFRTLRRYFLELVLPVLTVAAMSALTAVMLVLIVGAVADMGLYSQSREVTPDPWSNACSGPAFLWDRQTYPDDPPRMETLDADEPWPGSRSNDDLDVPWARWVPE